MESNITRTYDVEDSQQSGYLTSLVPGEYSLNAAYTGRRGNGCITHAVGP